MFKKLIASAVLYLFSTSSQAQVVITQPWFFKSTDSISVVFDANQGNRGLAAFTGSIYAHTGVITNVSSQWRYVKAAWGTADTNVRMTSLGNGRYRLSMRPRSYYGVPASETIRRLAFVFRNSDGTITGRNADGSDIFIDLADSTKINCAIVQPAATIGGPLTTVAAGQSLSFTGISDSVCSMRFDLNGTIFGSQLNDTLTANATSSNYGINSVRLIAQGTSTSDTATFSFLQNPPIPIAAIPTNSKDGVTYLNDSTVRLNLFAPEKDFVYVLGDFNNWQIDTAFLMNRTPDSSRYWIDITGLTPGREYVYQYYVDAEIKIADPYSEKILDPSNDGGINSATYPNPTPYPNGRTTGVASVLQTARPAYQWRNLNYSRPAKTDLVIYELLIRDFMVAHNYKGLTDTLAYLKNLGINAIELMPINEFSGNQSWGYNPSFFFAPDKYYGTREAFKAFIDSCHGKGIMVIMDMVFNHQELPSPMVQMYFDPSTGKPAANSPWFNPSAPHDFSVFYDMNHDSPHTRYFIDRVNEFWINEYKIDGYRYDLAKGFTQRYTLGNSSLFAAYDSTRVYNIERMANHIRSIDPNTYIILELFADNSEETRYANNSNGMMTWGNSNYNFNQATMGFASGSDFGGVSYKSRGWQYPHLIGYMESHDEERLMYKNISFGASNTNYNVKDTATGLSRIETAAAFFFSIPGPKMIWQGGELGYDVSINNPCRTCNQPFRWNYYSKPERLRIYRIYSELIKLRLAEPAFRTNNFNMQLTTLGKTIHLNHASMNVTVIGNFNITNMSINPVFQNTGWWYDYFSGDSIYVSNTTATLLLQPGEYHIYTTRRLTAPDLTTSIEENDMAPFAEATAFPNPSNSTVTIRYELEHSDQVEVTIYSIDGRAIERLHDGFQAAGEHEISWSAWQSDAAPGIYLCRITSPSGSRTIRIVVD
ncbi:MAG: alpha-amylase family glycosyl hydrolase [Bacteroidota bacterium]